MESSSRDLGQFPGVRLFGWFQRDGSGISSYSADLYDALAASGDCNVQAIEARTVLSRGARPFKGVIGNPLDGLLKYILEVPQSEQLLDHFLDCSLVPPKLLVGKRACVCTLYDLFAFDARYVEAGRAEYGGRREILAEAGVALRRQFYRRVRHCDLVVTISERVAAEAAQTFAIDISRLRTVYPVIPDSFRPVNHPSREPKAVIGYVNNFFRNKVRQLRVFIDAFKRVRDPDLEFRIYGRGFPLSAEIRDDERIRYFGFADERALPALYHEFDAFLLTDEYGGFCIPAMQAKASGVPVLCFAGDLPEITLANTLLWDSEKIEGILAGRAWKTVSVSRAREDALRCSRANVVPRLLRAYNDALSFRAARLQ